MKLENSRNQWTSEAKKGLLFSHVQILAAWETRTQVQRRWHIVIDWSLTTYLTMKERELWKVNGRKGPDVLIQGAAQKSKSDWWRRRRHKGCDPHRAKWFPLRSVNRLFDFLCHFQCECSPIAPISLPGWFAVTIHFFFSLSSTDNTILTCFIHLKKKIRMATAYISAARMTKSTGFLLYDYRR